MSTIFSDNKIDILLYKAEHVQVFAIPSPRKEDGYKHNISHWNADGKPLWEGNLEMHEIELIDNYGDDMNPFGDPNSSDSNNNNSNYSEASVNEQLKHEIRKDPRQSFKLELLLIDRITDDVFAVVPGRSALNLDQECILPTDSAKMYAIFPEIEGEDCELNVLNEDQLSNEDNQTLKQNGNVNSFTNSDNENTNIKRIGLCLKFPSSYEASNFNMYLKQFKKDYQIFTETFNDGIDYLTEVSNKKDSNKLQKSIEALKDYHRNSQSVVDDKQLTELENRFSDIDMDSDIDSDISAQNKTSEHVEDVKTNASKSSKFDSESDDSDDDFGDFQ